MLPLFAGTTGRDSKRHQPLPVVARRLCPYHSCRVPFVRSTRRASSSQKVPDTFLSHDPNQPRSLLPNAPYLPSKGFSKMQIRHCIVPLSMFFTIALGLFASHASAQLPITDTWQFKLRKPAEGWTEPKFDDQSWQTGNGGFGTRDSPGARVSTLWRTKNIWLRKSFELQSLPEQPALLLHHDEDAEIYLNGQQVAALEGWISEYKVVPLDGNQRQALRVGKNVLAVHCRQTDGGQFIDVHVIDAQQVP